MAGKLCNHCGKEMIAWGGDADDPIWMCYPCYEKFEKEGKHMPAEELFPSRKMRCPHCGSTMNHLMDTEEDEKLEGIFHCEVCGKYARDVVATPTSPQEFVKAAQEAVELQNNHELLIHSLYAIYCNAKAIVDTQTEMHPGHKALVQALVDGAEHALKPYAGQVINGVEINA